ACCHLLVGNCGELAGSESPITPVHVGGGRPLDKNSQRCIAFLCASSIIQGNPNGQLLVYHNHTPQGPSAGTITPQNPNSKSLLNVEGEYEGSRDQGFGSL